MTILTQQLPAYAYQQYADDPDIVAFFTAYNGTTITPVNVLYNLTWSGGIAYAYPAYFPQFTSGFQFTVVISDAGLYSGTFTATLYYLDNDQPYFTYELASDPGAFDVGNYQIIPEQPASQGYLDEVNALNLPNYLDQTGSLLDWVGHSLYGQNRFDLPTLLPLLIGPYNTYVLNTMKFANTRRIEPRGETVITITDLDYQRILQWNNYKGDGFYCTIRWVKRRVQRFLEGIFSYESMLSPNPEETYQVSVQIIGFAVVITLYTGVDSMSLASTLQACILSKILEIPFQYNFSVVIVDSPPPPLP